MRPQVYVNLVWVAAGLYLAWSGRDLGIGSMQDPGSGFLLFGLGIAMAVIAAGSLAIALASNPPQATENPDNSAKPVKVLLLGGLFLAYLAAFVPAGFLISTFGLLLVLFAVGGKLSWVSASAISAATSAAIYVVFKIGLGAQLPAGLFG